MTRLFFVLYSLFLSTLTYAYDLLDAWHATENYNAHYAALSAKYRAEQELQTQGRAGLLPEVKFTTRYDYTDGSTNYDNIPEKMENSQGTEYALSLTQPIFDLKKLTLYRKNQIKQTDAQVRFDESKQKLMVKVAKAYLAVLFAQESLSATQESKAFYQRKLDQAKTKFSVGAATRSDIAEAQASYDGAVAKEIKQQNQFAQAGYYFTRLTGLPANHIQPLVKTLSLELPVPGSLNEWLSIADANNLTAHSSSLKWALAKQDLAQARAGHLPTLEFNARYSDGSLNNVLVEGNNIKQYNRKTEVGLTLTVPIFAGGKTNSEVRETAALLNESQDNLEDARREAREGVHKAWLDMTTGIASIRAQEQRLASEKSKLDALQLGQEIGERTTLEVLEAQEKYSEVVISLAQARYEYLEARLALSQAAGVLDENALKKINQSIEARPAEQRTEDRGQRTEVRSGDHAD